MIFLSLITLDWMKSKLFKPTLTTSMIIITILFVVGLALTVKYSYIDEIPHHHNDTCHILDCSSYSVNCKNLLICGNSKNMNPTCYRITVTFELHLNETNYTKTSQELVSDPNYCDRTSIVCYYDDRNILDSLSFCDEYSTGKIVVGIFWLAAGVVTMTLMTVAIIGIFYCSTSESSDYVLLNNMKKMGYESV